MPRWLGFAALFLTTLALAQPTPLGALYGPVKVASVVDGDTFVVESNVGPRTVRLLGVDAPEPQPPAVGREPFGPEAAAWLRARLPAGALVWLELDLGPEDAFGRLLAYAYVADPRGAWTIDGAAPTPLARSVAEGLPPAPIVIACVLYAPDTPNDTDAESVTLLLRERLDTRGYYLWDEGSGTAFRLPVGEQGPGELTIGNPGQGVWNNGGDTGLLLPRGG